MIMFPLSTGSHLLYRVDENGRCFLYEGNQLIGVKMEPSISHVSDRDGDRDVVEAFPWEWKREEHALYEKLLYNVFDMPSFPVQPADGIADQPGTMSVWHIHSINLIDTYELGFTTFMDYGPAFYVTCTTSEGFMPLVIDGDNKVHRVSFDAEFKVVLGELVSLKNLTYFVAVIRNWLAQQLGEEWKFFS